MLNESQRVIDEHVQRYFCAVYGQDYVYRAPETFTNALERWMLYIANEDFDAADKEMSAIENHCKRSN